MPTSRSFVVLNGFDRSGTSMMAKVLASHPEVEALIQPFSSTTIHEAQWERWPPERRDLPTETFIEGLLRGDIDHCFLASDWFEEHSTTTTVEPQKLYVIKSTKLHFKVEWWEARFPEIPFWSVWRDPRAVICSLLRNNFYRSWYGVEAYRALRDYVESDPDLPEALRMEVANAETVLERMSVIVAVRSDVMFRSARTLQCLRYESVLEDPNAVLGDFLSHLNLDRQRHNFFPSLELDQNIVGKFYERPDLWRDYFSHEEIERIQEIFLDVGPDP